MRIAKIVTTSIRVEGVRHFIRTESKAASTRAHRSDVERPEGAD
jgi:hypothetical protein